MTGLNWEDILPGFQRPGRYAGNEYNGYEPRENGKRFLLCFPDDYSIGMSSLGYHTVGNIIDSTDGFSCERCFAPAPDMEDWMRKNRVELYSLESKMPASRFDIMGFSFHYELSYTNFINMLDLAGLEPFRSRRSNGAPLIMGGGPTCVNPEILSQFLDLMIIGEAEGVLPGVLDLFNRIPDKRDFLKEVSTVPGVFVPDISDRTGIAVYERFDNRYYPTAPPVPVVDIPHNRINLEITRGCRNRCRFCQASVIYSPYREKTVEQVMELVAASVAATGYDEISLTSLSATDHSGLMEIMDRIHFGFRDLGVSAVMSSMRVSGDPECMLDRLTRHKKGGLTLAPETASDRMKNVIGKNVSGERLARLSSAAARRGWRKIKLYFMLGLPGEDYPDIDENIRLIKHIKKSSGIDVNVTVSFLNPQPHTPFQWLKAADPDILEEKAGYMSRKAPAAIKKFDKQMYIIESILARGDRGLAGTVYEAWKLGSRFDQWSEHFDFSIWEKAFEASGRTWMEYYFRDFDKMEKLPWEHIVPHQGVDKLRGSFSAAVEAITAS